MKGPGPYIAPFILMQSTGTKASLQRSWEHYKLGVALRNDLIFLHAANEVGISRKAEAFAGQL